MTEQEKQEWQQMKVQKIEVSPEAQKKIVEMINNPRPMTEAMQRLLASRNALSESFTRGLPITHHLLSSINGRFLGVCEMKEFKLQPTESDAPTWMAQ